MKPCSHVAIVTGANHGIGAAVARALAHDGVGVMCTYLRVEDLVDPSIPEAYRINRRGDANEVVERIVGSVMAFCNARQMTAPEAYIQFSTDTFGEDGTIADESTRDFLANFLAEFRDHIIRVLTVLPRQPA